MFRGVRRIKKGVVALNHWTTGSKYFMLEMQVSIIQTVTKHIQIWCSYVQFLTIGWIPHRLKNQYPSFVKKRPHLYNMTLPQMTCRNYLQNSVFGWICRDPYVLHWDPSFGSGYHDLQGAVKLDLRNLPFGEWDHPWGLAFCEWQSVTLSSNIFMCNLFVFLQIQENLNKNYSSGIFASGIYPEIPCTYNYT